MHIGLEVTCFTGIRVQVTGPMTKGKKKTKDFKKQGKGKAKDQREKKGNVNQWSPLGWVVRKSKGKWQERETQLEEREQQEGF